MENILRPEEPIQADRARKLRYPDPAINSYGGPQSGLGGQASGAALAQYSRHFLNQWLFIVVLREYQAAVMDVRPEAYNDGFRSSSPGPGKEQGNTGSSAAGKGMARATEYQAKRLLFQAIDREFSAGHGIRQGHAFATPGFQHSPTAG